MIGEPTGWSDAMYFLPDHHSFQGNSDLSEDNDSEEIPPY